MYLKVAQIEAKGGFVCCSCCCSSIVSIKTYLTRTITYTKIYLNMYQKVEQIEAKGVLVCCSCCCSSITSIEMYLTRTMICTRMYQNMYQKVEQSEQERVCLLLLLLLFHCKPAGLSLTTHTSNLHNRGSHRIHLFLTRITTKTRNTQTYIREIQA